MIPPLNGIWKTIRQCFSRNDGNQNDEAYQPIVPVRPTPRRSASPDSVADSVTLTIRSSVSECSRASCRENEELRKAFHPPGFRSRDPSFSSMDSGYETISIQSDQ